MYKAIGQEAKVPFKLKQLQVNIWSFDGFCYYLYHTPEAFTRILHEKTYLNWLADEVGMGDLVEELRALMASDHKLVETVELIVTHSPYTAALNHDHLIQTFEVMDKMRVEERYKHWGIEAFKATRYKEALSYFKQAQAIYKQASVTNNMALVYLEMDDYDRAKTYFLQCLQEDDQPVYRLNLIRLYSILQAWQDMLVELNQLKLVFESSEMWYYYGRAYEGLNRMEEAIAAYVKALEEEASFTSLEAFVRLAEQEKATDFLKAWMKHGQVSMAGKSYIGACLAKTAGDEEGYVLGLEQAGQLAASSLPYLLKLARYYREKGQIIKSIMYIEQIDPKEQSREDVQFERSMIAKDAGNTETYERLVNQMTDCWKSEVRKASGR